MKESRCGDERGGQAVEGEGQGLEGAEHLRVNPCEETGAEITNRAYDGARLTSAAVRNVGRTSSPTGERKHGIPMTNKLGLKSWATGALVLAAVTACANSDPESEPSVSPPETSSVTSVATTAPASPAEIATSDATALMRTYFEVLDDLRTHPGGDLKRLKTIATSEQLGALETFIDRQYGAEQHQTGSTVLRELMVQSVDLDDSDPDAGNVPTVVIDVCWDVGQVDVLDKAGQSVVLPERPDIGWTRYTVANYEYAMDPAGGWRVATGEDLEKTPCDAS